MLTILYDSHVFFVRRFFPIVYNSYNAIFGCYARGVVGLPPRTGVTL